MISIEIGKLQFIKRNIRYFFLLLAFLLISLNSGAQIFKLDKSIIDPIEYDSIINNISKLNYINLSNYNDLYKIKMKSHYNEEITLFGFITNNKPCSISFFDLSDQEISIPRMKLISKKKIIVNDSIANILEEYSPDRDVIHRFSSLEVMAYYIITFWLHQKGYIELSMKFASNIDTYSKSKEGIIDAFGDLYYNEMLIAYSHERDFDKAIKFGKLFNKEVFLNYEYRQTAISITHQLELRKNDFKTLRLPKSSSWDKLKEKLNREEQLKYLLDRLYLMNCIQIGQPAFISNYSSQTSIPYKKLTNKYSSYHHIRMRYYKKEVIKHKVINPYVELMNLEPNVSEIKYFLPLLLDSSYIPTFSFHRDFFSSRSIHQLNWLIEELIEENTYRDFIDIDEFNELSLIDKEKQIALIYNWCEENKGLNREELIKKIMSETTDWNEFSNGMKLSVQYNYISVIPIIKKRYYDFNDDFSYYISSQKGSIAKTMFEIGSEKDNETIRMWFNNSNDRWVKIWTSLFQLKYDNENYKPAIDTLKNILDKDYDGNMYNIRINDALISINDSNTNKLLEDYISKNSFTKDLEFSYKNHDLLKILLLRKSDIAYNLLYSGLCDNTIYKKYYDSDTGKEIYHYYFEIYRKIIDSWRLNKNEYQNDWDLERKIKYSKLLANWLQYQYSQIKKGEKHDLIIK